MNIKYLPDNILKEDFERLLSKYPSIVPEKLKELDESRLHTIPDALEKRRKKGDAFLEKDEVESLVRWKISHGTFRPQLLALATSNTNIPSVTREAFASLSSPPTEAEIKHAMTVLTTLKGIGPATASLLLSTYAPDEIPFFSDELFRWVNWADPKVKGTEGWERKIGYTAKEYSGLNEKVGNVRRQLEVGCRDLECVAWVLGKMKGDFEDVVDDDGVAATKKFESTKVKTKGTIEDNSGDKGVAVKAKSESSKAKKKEAYDETKVEQTKHEDGQRRSKRLKKS